MKVISFVSQKGGVGKTHCACNTAASLALHHGQRVCLIDVDEQASAATGVGVNPPDKRPTLGDKIIARKLVDCVFQTPIKNLYAIPADASVNALRFANTDMKERLLEFAVKGLEKFFDYLVIDTPSGLGLWTWNAVYVSDRIVIPVQADEAAERGVLQTIEWVKPIVTRFRPDVSLSTFYLLLMTIVDRDNRVLNDLLREFLKREFPKQVLDVEIRKRAAIPQARIAHKSIFEFAKQEVSQGARDAVEDFKLLTKEIQAHEGKKQERENAARERRAKASVG